jgi:uncharacterized protein
VTLSGARLAPGVFTGDMTTSGDTPHDPQSPPPAGPPPGAYHPPAGVVSSIERNWALAAHVGSFVAAAVALGFVAPLIVLLAKGGESPFIRRHAVESLNFQINALIWIAVCVVLMFVLIGIPLLVAYGLFYAVCVIVGSVRASNGQDYRYPMTARFVS